MTTVLEPKCFTRECVHYLGTESRNEKGQPPSVRHVCDAFPDEIPGEISYGDNLHLKPLKNQKNDIVFEKITPNLDVS